MSAIRWTPEQLEAHRRRMQLCTRPADVNHLRLTLPFPPTLNHVGKDGRRYGRKTDRYHAFMGDVAKIVRDNGSPRIEGRLAMVIDIVPPNRRAFDLDNRIKALADALQKAGVYADDACIDDFRIRRMPLEAPGDGAAIVTITRIPA